jgi:hypothetical protein
MQVYGDLNDISLPLQCRMALQTLVVAPVCLAVLCKRVVLHYAGANELSTFKLRTVLTTIHSFVI